MWFVTLNFTDGDSKSGPALEFHSTVLVTETDDRPAVEIAWLGSDSDLISIYDLEQIQSLVICPQKRDGS